MPRFVPSLPAQAKANRASLSRPECLEPWGSISRGPFRVNSRILILFHANPVDLSISGATAYTLCGEITVAYTGDFRLHGKNGDATRDFVIKAKDASVLIIEGTRAGPTEGEKTTEQSVCDVCRGGVEASSGLVIANFSPRNSRVWSPSLR